VVIYCNFSHMLNCLLFHIVIKTYCCFDILSEGTFDISLNIYIVSLLRHRMWLSCAVPRSSILLWNVYSVLYCPICLMRHRILIKLINAHLNDILVMMNRIKQMDEDCFGREAKCSADRLL